jgi:hypothetical protein
MLNDLEGLIEELQWTPYDEEKKAHAAKVHHMLGVDDICRVRGT